MNEEIKNLQCGYLRLSEDGILLEGNDYFTEMTGSTKEEMINKPMDYFLSDASRITFHSHLLLQILVTNQIDELYLTLQTKEREDIPIQLNARFIQDERERFIECVFVRTLKRCSYERELQTAKKELETAYQEKEKMLDEENRLRKLFETTLYSIHEGIIVTDRNGLITGMNKLAERYTGWSSPEAVGRPFTEVFQAVNINNGEKCAADIMKKLEEKQRYETIKEVKLVSKNNSEIYIEGTASYIRQDNEINGAVTTFRDVTKLFFQDNIIDSFLNINMEILCVYDLNLHIHKINKKFMEITGFMEDELLGRSVLSYIHEDDAPETKKTIENCKGFHEIHEVTNRVLCKNGDYKFFEWRIQLSMGEFIFASARDVTSKKQENESLVNIAMKDHLTGLFNRHYLDRMIYEEMDLSDKREENISLAILDLDKFKLVNDTWGHPVGDDQLKTMADITASCLRKGDWLIRFGGEEFVVILPNTKAKDAVMALEKVRKSYEEYRHPVTGRQTLSAGVAEKMQGESFMSWYKRADEALYEAKNGGRNKVVSK